MHDVKPLFQHIASSAQASYGWRDLLRPTTRWAVFVYGK